MQDVTRPLTYDERLAQAVLDDEADADRAALALFERHAPQSLSQAVGLIAHSGPLPPETFDRIAQAYDIHRHARDMPWD